ARAAGARTVEARVLSVLGFSLAYLEDATAGAAALDEAVVVAEGTGEPEAIIEAHVRRAELLAGPLNRLEEGIAYARTGLERMRELGLARTAGVALLTYAANAQFRMGRWAEAQKAVAEAWELRPTGAAALDVRLSRARIDIARGDLDDAAADLEAVELLARATTGPRQRLPLLVLFAALALWRRRPDVALGHVEEGFAVVEAGADDILAVAPLVWHATWAWADVVAGGHPPPSQAQVERLRHHCAELARRGSGTVPAVRSSIEAFSLMCTAETGRAEQATDPQVWEQAADTFDRLQHPYPSAYARMRQAEALLVRRAHSTHAADVLRRADGLGVRWVPARCWRTSPRWRAGPASRSRRRPPRRPRPSRVCSPCSPRASWRCCTRWPTATPTRRSASGSSSARRRWACTSPGSSRRSVCTAGCRPAPCCTAQTAQPEPSSTSRRSLRRALARVGPMLPIGIPVRAA